MVYLSKIKFRGFKSFRRADVVLAPSFVALAGPNGSGKSNVTDAIRFGLGEMALRSLRAKKVSELINTSSKQAEVTLQFDGEKQFEIKRAIRSDGKIAYRLNGKKITRTGLLEALRPASIEAGTHNIIAQGQVQQIVEMNSKERRQIVDSVAGISEYEEKKKEALGNLEKVEARIRENEILMAEKEGYLKQLEKEKDDALEFTSAQGRLKSARATLLSRELEKIKSDFDSTNAKIGKINAQIEGKKEELSKVEAEIRRLEAAKEEITRKINDLSRKNTQLQAVATLKAKIEAAKSGFEEKIKSAESLAQKIAGFEKSKAQIESDMSKLEVEVTAAKAEADAIQKKIDDYTRKVQSHTAQGRLDTLKSEIGLISAEIEQQKLDFGKIQGEIQTIEQLHRVRSEELEGLKVSVGEDSGKGEKLANELESVAKDIASASKDIEKLWAREREINKLIPDIDRKILDIREKMAIARVNAAPQSANPGIVALKELSAAGVVKGYYGTVSELIKFDADYATAIEAAGGSRLNYAVVDTTTTASRAIEYLKKKKSGRCTFIPLDRIIGATSQETEKLRKKSGVLGTLLEFVKFDQKYYGAMSYVFADTLVVENVEVAKEIGAGRARMVTLDGELFERSGTVTGGFLKAAITARALIEKLDSDHSDAKGERAGLEGELESIRSEMAKKRKDIASLEIMKKTIEMELGGSESAKNKAADDRKRVSMLEKQIAELKSQKAEKEAEFDRLGKSISDAESERKKTTDQIGALEAKAKTETSEAEKEYSQLLSRKSDLAGTLKANMSKLEMLGGSLKGLTGERDGSKSELSSLKKRITQLEAETKSDIAELKKKEAELSETSSAIEKLFTKSKELDAAISSAGQKKGGLDADVASLSRGLSDLQIAKAKAEARIPDLSGEFEQYKGVEMTEGSREELLSRVKESEAKMNSLGTVNLAAPRAYEEKKKDIEDVRGKLDKLAEEKNAVFAMIDEVEAKKHNIFMETFKSISDNFRKIFGYIFKGEGMLVLEKPSDPFAGGLSMKIIEDTQSGKKDRYIESMSGGEKSLLAIIFIFAIQTHKPSAFYILDEADAALDKENSKKLAQLVKQMSQSTQFIVVTHNDSMLSAADVVLGVTKTPEGSQIVGINLSGKKIEMPMAVAPVEPKGQRKIPVQKPKGKPEIEKEDEEEDFADAEEEKIEE
ncbi:MAG: chromosome segregation protein SMC [Candidatus Micrarchaeia archaeon]